MLSTGKRLLKKIGIDGAIALTLLSRIIQASGGLISIVFIAKFLTGNEQGYYYTFASIIAIQIFFELGLSGIITQYTAHEFAHLQWVNGELHGEEYNKSRLSSLLRFCVKWFGILSVVLFFILVAAGFCFFSNYNKGLTVQWQYPWILLCLTTSLNLFIDPVLAFIEGLGEVKDVAKVRLIQKTAFTILLFIFFVLGFRLYSGPLASLIAIGINYIQVLFSKRRKVLFYIWGQQREWIINYIDEIFPYQWRIALSWISGYFIFQLFNPILFAREGAISAGRMGMTLQALTGISALSMSWINTKVPLFSSLISKKQYLELDNLFNKTLKNLVFVNALLILFFIIAIYGLSYFGLPLRNRFLPNFSLLCMALTILLSQFIFAWATYLRCHKKEPLLIQAIVSAIYCSFSTIVFGNLFGLNGLVVGYTFWIVLSTFWVYYIYASKKKLWHQDNYSI